MLSLALLNTNWQTLGGALSLLHLCCNLWVLGFVLLTQDPIIMPKNFHAIPNITGRQDVHVVLELVSTLQQIQ